MRKQENAGYSVDGSFGQYMLVDSRYPARIPDGADLAEVALIQCAGVTVYKGLKMTEARPGEWVAISGIGGLGHVAVQYAKAMGLRVAAVDPSAFSQAIHMSRRGGTIVFNGLPAGNFPASIFEIVVKGLTVRGSIVGTRQDLVEALEFYARGQIHPTVATRQLGDINAVFDEMRHGKIAGRIVIKY